MIRRRSCWLVVCASLLAVLLPLQGIALSLDAAWRPAHVHRHAAIDLRAGDAADMRRSALAAADTILDDLPQRTHGHDHDVDGHPLPSTRTSLVYDATHADAIAVASRTTRHGAIGHHLHTLGDPEVVYADDNGQMPDSTTTGVGKMLSDGMVM
ncbi:MAG: hypothetical protein ACREO8_13900, partial [Luteimonas sp.]